ncbi:MAG TPA: trypsin-like peptidase domain-containing protein [Candidatus Thiothrix moscowensis]|uniref:S1C family serine protease n=1 Tax=unclassified Thiothrix TaxID=2636184 RepID=UPI0025DB07EB|nr:MULTISPECIES: trypsin-like peptidase domain-containing protein [unclassified Thiothrix]HRJ51943.1 trypsin-like peptidase domain-containing protein [Candidatus Thiothrix moscowensis]HRJ92258.1 trypsin-like peptidase domain-containing protein [Candidatus Thiothrix moscowensis]
MTRILSACFIGIFLSGCSLVQGQYDALLNPRESGKAFAAVTRQVSPSVVSVQSEFPIDPASLQLSPVEQDFLRRYFGELPKPRDNLPPEDVFDVAQGSGFVFRTEGGRTYVLTTNHLVENASKVRVVLLNGQELDATVKGVDSHSDIALLEMPAVDVPPLPLGNSTQLDVGEWVLAIGNPFGLQHTLTVGVVSAKGRTELGINDYEDFIQTDAAINPGNSGGPLVNLDGQVVGMNTAIFSSSGGYMGIGFAIPVNFVKSVADQLIQQGTVVRGQIGVMLQPLTRDVAQRLQLERGQGGILVTGVQPGSPAARAGVQVDDVIISFAGQPVVDVGDFRNRVAASSPGSRQELGVLRRGARETLAVDMGRLP